MWSHRPSFTVALTCAFRAIHLRDRLLGRIPARQTETPGVSVSTHSIPSGRNLLDAIYAEPSAQPARATVLICHGIGEVVEQWFPIQRILADHGVASLVFDYSGYGRSTGFIDWTQCEQDAIAAFHRLESLTPTHPASILGFSLGTGIVPAVIGQLKVNRIVLCASFTSFCEASHSIGIPRVLGPLVPPIWSAEQPLRACGLPVMVVHSTGDRLFPVQMARELAAWAGAKAELVVVPGIGHNEPFYRPSLSYWRPIAAFLTSGEGSRNQPATDHLPLNPHHEPLTTDH